MATVTGGVIIRAVAESMIWNGTTAYSYAGGDGSAENPYQIANGAQLAKLVQETDTTGKYYVLTADIQLNDVRSYEWKENNPRIWFGKWNSPVEMQQKATLRAPCAAASAKQLR